MNAILKSITPVPSTEPEREYLAQIVVDGVVKEYRFAVPDDPRNDLDYGPDFGNDFLRLHLGIAVKIMNLICNFASGQPVDLPQQLSD